MKLFSIVLLLFLSFPLVVPAQNNYADSLLDVLNGAESSDERTNTLYKLSNYWFQKNHDSALAYAYLLKDASLKDSNKHMAFFAYYFIALIRFDKNRFEEAMEESLEALKYFESKEDKNYRANILVLLAEKNRAKKQYTAAINYLSEANSIRMAFDDSVFHAQVYNRLAAIRFEMAEYKLTIADLEQSNLLLSNFNNPDLTVSNFELLGAVYRENGELEKALESFQMALSRINEVKDSGILPNLLNNIASTYCDLNEHEKAIEFAQKSLELAARDSIKDVLNISDEILANAYAGLGDTTKAFKFLELHHQLEHELFDEERDQRISELNALYEAEKKEKQIEGQLYEIKEKNSQNLILILGVVFLFFTLSIIVFVLLKLKRINIELIGKNQKIIRQADELELKNEELTQLAKFKEDMTNMIIHDLKNPLNTIISLPELRNELDNCDQLIQESGKQMLYLIQNILDVYKYENGSMDLTKTEIHLRQLIKLAFREVAVLANESNIRFEILTGTDYVLNADRELLKRVLINLFSNAVKYSMQCTDVFIRIIEIDDAKVKVEVMDHGIGIEADEISYVFDKYARVKNKTANLVGSTGLGLAFCKMAVEAHGGEIGVESVPGVGSTFWFTLSYQSKLQ